MNLAGRIQSRLMCLLVRQNFSNECERALNKQIRLELKSSYDYLAMAYHFDRSDVALPGMHRFFQEASMEERKHAETLMDYMNKRGGQICLEALPPPELNFISAAEALKQALEMEKTVNEALLKMHVIATEQNDAQLCDFLETQFLKEQVDTQKQLADYITQIERCREELGTFIFDINLKEKNPHSS